MYKIYLKDLKISGNIVELYKYLKKSITNISPNESIKFTKKIKKDLKNNFFEKLSNVNNNIFFKTIFFTSNYFSFIFS